PVPPPPSPPSALPLLPRSRCSGTSSERFPRHRSTAESAQETPRRGANQPDACHKAAGVGEVNKWQGPSYSSRRPASLALRPLPPGAEVGSKQKGDASKVVGLRVGWSDPSPPRVGGHPHEVKQSVSGRRCQARVPGHPPGRSRGTANDRPPWTAKPLLL